MLEPFTIDFLEKGATVNILHIVNYFGNISPYLLNDPRI